MRDHVRRRGLMSLALLITVLAVPSMARANVTTTYPTNPEARTFSKSLGNWTASAKTGGICVPFVNCPAILNTHEAAGGTGGADDGFLRTQITSIAGAAAESVGIFESPVFKYTGAAGGTPDTLSYTMSMRIRDNTFLGVAGNHASYKVELLSGASGDDVVAVLSPEQSVSRFNNWVKLGPYAINPENLQGNGNYRIRITTGFINSATVGPGLLVDYDDPTIEATAFGQDGITLRELRTLIVKELPSDSRVSPDGKYVSLKLKCPKAVKRNCRYGVVGLNGRGRDRLTLPRFARVAPGKAKVVRLVVRPGFREAVLHKKSILFRIRGRVGLQTVTIFKTVKTRVSSTG